jgi:hypothetical protein
MSSEPRVMRPMPMGTRECMACAGTGDTSPWEHDHHIWLRGEPIAVCGACKGAGKVGRWGFPLSAAKALAQHRQMSNILFGSDKHAR